MDHEEKYNTARWDAGQVRREGGERPPHSAQSAASEERRRRNRRKGRERRFLLWLIFVVAVSAILAGVGWLLANDMCAFNKEPVTATIEVTKDDDVNSIATKLKNEGLIEYKWFFKLFGAVRHAGDKIGIGTYELNTDMDYNALIQGMSNRNATINADTVTVTIPEGYSFAAGQVRHQQRGCAAQRGGARELRLQLPRLRQVRHRQARGLSFPGHLRVLRQ